MFTYSFVGTPETVTSELRAFLKMTRADELIVSNPIFDHAARLRSLELTAMIRGSERLRVANTGAPDLFTTTSR